MKLDFQTGRISPSPHTSIRRLKDIDSIFEDSSAREKLDPETIIYETYGYAGDQEGENLLYGTNVLMPGKVGHEFFMTRGHFHVKPERGELCLTISGSGILLLMDRQRNSKQESMRPGTLHDIDGSLAHRVVNTGSEPLIFFVTWMSDCGHDYETARALGFLQVTSSSS